MPKRVQDIDIMDEMVARGHLPILPAGMRLYAIGDMHGRKDHFDVLMQQIIEDNNLRGSPGRQGTHIVGLGDYIDRGMESKALIDFFLHPMPSSFHWHFIGGNHETAMINIFSSSPRKITAETLSDWLSRYGGRETMISYGVEAHVIDKAAENLKSKHVTQNFIDKLLMAWRARIPPSHFEFLFSLPDSLQFGDYFFAHAGIRPGITLNKQKSDDLRRIRGEFLRDKSDHGAVIVHGHSMKPEPQIRSNRIGIDTGAYTPSGRLTVLGLEGGSRWLMASGRPGFIGAEALKQGPLPSISKAFY
ncbi:MAG: metallophosphoesterase [Zymomonas mobilis subsp. pomaceae]|uniref:Bis(5'nucleosyl)-tetraphosphatase, ApaH n=1 Tax=Zymomonas mobilis subsp. pomaceae (strain ATCC 29192 / DSM 22645 / JCM 10191 / CCUG 17912 / NBRC 13757 / NCIMB 11200 / NRRL B-4491 / Barker I) TaxID=579138 RepID=F8EV48_ZYMMT|nr:metallophosphoesterase [Zymomonas mobilis]AEI38266.1 bis(5'nucleosyl)-tetraphosphatase, ApaH [Zymomonas mobilis subsp. pomaceae ATCC 29192]MDX5947955.1 metallophosphoesterase [Zymomonas mobilis subsp. pomaceae]GEB89284.1 ser/threonine protein phosphatase [Zymomonas mobilis subsp. pomaceae]